ncbi:hypothetical protein [Streptomyces sp. NPDC048282]|uniref:hypothetical protein n=1 Tax=Streptomyces sp. NPDC048282 TaxID=3365528 RepID=UPI00371DE213
MEIEGRRTSAGYPVAIVDHGLGMDTQALAEANVRLSGTAGFMAEPTRFLGHFVVGALARKRGIEVRLGEAPAAAAAEQPAVPAPRKGTDEAPLVPVATEGAKPAEAARPEQQQKKGASAARIRNGLVKRPRRSQIADAVGGTGRGGGGAGCAARAGCPWLVAQFPAPPSGRVVVASVLQFWE